MKYRIGILSDGGRLIVRDFILGNLGKRTLHMSLLDPDKQSAEEAAELAQMCKDAGTDAIMIGGSTGISNENLDETAERIKSKTGLPVIYFPAGPHALASKADAMFYMSLVNSTDLKWVIRAQAMASLAVKKIGIETISMGYIIVEPGMKVGEVGQAEPVKRDDLKGAMSWALGCELMGMSLVYLEAGSGADRPVPPEMISAVKGVLSVPLIVGGGIRTPEAAKAARDAGADIIVTGTFVERCHDPGMLKAVIDAVKG